MTDGLPASDDFTPAALVEVGEPIVARAGRYYRNMRFLMVLGLFIFAGFFAYDGFQRYPAQNAAIAEVEQALANATGDEAKAALARRQSDLGHGHSETDIALQKKLAVVLPFVAVGYLIFILRRSRGEIRLENNTLYVPGYAPIPLSAITSIDSSLWKKKGIAFVHFKDGGKEKSLRLDDFIYQQKPIDAIYDRLVMTVTSPAVAANSHS